MTNASDISEPDKNQHRGQGYLVRVKGCLSADVIAHLDWPGECDEASGETLITLYPADQAALYGFMNRLRDMALRLVSVSSITRK